MTLESDYLELLLGATQSYILETLLSNIFLNVLLIFIMKVSLHHYGNDNALSASFTYVTSLMKQMSQEANTTIDWQISSQENSKLTPRNFRLYKISGVFKIILHHHLSIT